MLYRADPGQGLCTDTANGVTHYIDGKKQQSASVAVTPGILGINVNITERAPVEPVQDGVLVKRVQDPAPMEPRKCYSGGDAFVNMKLANDTVDAICTSSGVSGNFNVGQNKTHCALDDKKSGLERNIVYVVRWEGKGGPAFLNDDDCKLRLKKEINGCRWTGGRQTTADWFFK
jgi:hypothetical protein